MTSPNWTLFGAAALLVTAGLVVLSRVSARALRTDARAETESGPEADGHRRAIPTGVALLANVALTHGLVAFGLVALVWYASIPPGALGVGPLTTGLVGVGIGLGVGLYLVGEAATYVADRVGIEYDERLRESLAPDRASEWALLLFLILPLIAGAEELLFRGILVGALGAGFGLPVWGLAVGSSVAFGLGHSAQGPVGVAVTAALGLVLAGAFVLTGSLAVVVLAHYTVNALEFVVREGVLR